MKKKCSRIFTIFGAMLLCAALFLVLYNLYQDKKSGEISHGILSELKQVISEQTLPGDYESLYTMPSENLYDEYENSQEEVNIPTVFIDGKEYIGYISIPELGIELPVTLEWNYENLRIAPCLYRGSAGTGDMIIAAHNYRSHFGNISSLNAGDNIIFTDAEGKIYYYEVVQSDLVDGYDVDSMLQGAGDSWNLTIFTCTLNGQSRVSVRAVEIDRDSDPI